MRAWTPAESLQRYTWGSPVGSATNHRSRSGVQTTSSMLPRVSTNATASAGDVAGHSTSDHRPSAQRTPATQRPSGDGARSVHRASPESGEGGGAGTVGRPEAGPRVIAASRPPPPAGATRRAPRVTRRHSPAAGSQ